MKNNKNSKNMRKIVKHFMGIERSFIKVQSEKALKYGEVYKLKRVRIFTTL